MLRDLLVLGRVSSLPTIWTNVLAGTVLSQAVPGLGTLELVLVIAAVSLLFVGSECLSGRGAGTGEDALSRDDAGDAPTMDRGSLVYIGYGCLVAGIALGFWFNLAAGFAALALAVAAVCQSFAARTPVIAALVQGVCRALGYAMAALAAGDITSALWIGAAGLGAHVIGLGLLARQADRADRAALWPLVVLALPLLAAAWLIHNPYFTNMIGWGLLAIYGLWALWSLRHLFPRPSRAARAVANLTAGIALFDGVMIAAMGATVLAAAALIGFALTLALQRMLPGR